MTRELQLLVNLAAMLRNYGQQMQQVNPEYARVLLERADMHERKALELPAWGRA